MAPPLLPPSAFTGHYATPSTEREREARTRPSHVQFSEILLGDAQGSCPILSHPPPPPHLPPTSIGTVAGGGEGGGELHERTPPTGSGARFFSLLFSPFLSFSLLFSPFLSFSLFFSLSVKIFNNYFWNSFNLELNHAITFEIEWIHPVL